MIERALLTVIAVGAFAALAGAAEFPAEVFERLSDLLQLTNGGEWIPE